MKTWSKERRDRKHKLQDMERKSADDVRRQVDDASIAMISELRNEVGLLTRRLRDTEKDLEGTRHDRDRGWDRARWWEAKCHSLKHLLINLLHAANLGIELVTNRYNDLAERWREPKIATKTIVVPDIFLPGLEDPLPSEKQEAQPSE